jgi:Xaa-Pro aminopeptidase
MKVRMGKAAIVFLVLAYGATVSAAGPLLFDKTEYAARRARLMEKIPDGAAILLGATPATGYGEFVQNNDMMYFAGVEIPNAALMIDGRSKTSTLFFTITDSGARNEGISLDLVRNAAAVTGIERVSPVDQFTPALSRLAGSGAVLYTSFQPEELARECSAEKLGIVQNAMTLNLWDGRLTRELQFVKNLRERFPQATVKDAAPFIWELRSIKSPAEIDQLRKVGRLGVEAHKAMMRATRVGAPEYEMSAAFEYASKKAGATSSSSTPDRPSTTTSLTYPPPTLPTASSPPASARSTRLPWQSRKPASRCTGPASRPGMCSPGSSRS